jgi:hypothetical protein
VTLDGRRVAATRIDLYARIKTAVALLAEPM